MTELYDGKVKSLLRAWRPIKAGAYLRFPKLYEISVKLSPNQKKNLGKPYHRGKPIL